MTDQMKAAKHICKTLQEAGHEAVFAGGCVRDVLLNRPFNDIDVATSATPDQVERLFKKTVAVGKAFGVINVHVDNEDIEVATFRIDGHYSDGRRPDTVEFSSMEEDAKRRDLTINAVFWDPVADKFFDFVGGVEDAKNGVIQFVGNGHERIKEDKLRILRAARFAARFDFSVTEETAKAMFDHRDEVLANVSIERVKAEFDKMLKLEKPSRAFRILRNLGILEHVFPELDALHGSQQSARWHSEGDVWTHVMLVLDHTRERTDDVATLWSALLHDIGKPATAGLNKRGDISNHGHEFLGEKMTHEILERFKSSTKERQKAAFLVREHMRVKKVGQMKRFKVRRLAASEHIEALIDLGWGDSMGSHAVDPELDKGKFDWMKVLEDLDNEVGLGLPRPVMDGSTLKEMGFKPGPNFKVILDKVQEAQLEDRILTNEDARAFVLRRFKGMMNG